MKLSQKGEKIACFYYRNRGFRILTKNFRTSLGEIDVIAYNNGLLVFCEVKTRNNLKFGQPFEAVNAQKQKKIKLLAECFIKYQKADFQRIRFDVISILFVQDNLYNLNHIEDAF